VDDCAAELLPLVLDDAPSGHVVLMHLGHQPTEVVIAAPVASSS
jgi:hypothetical protein